MITKRDIRAIKKCTTLCFRLQNGNGTIEALKGPSLDEKENNPFASTVGHVISTQSYVKDYAGSGTYQPLENYECFTSEDNHRFTCGEVALLGYLLKPDWCVKLTWHLCTKAESHFLEIEIINKAGKTVGGFKVPFLSSVKRC